MDIPSLSGLIEAKITKCKIKFQFLQLISTRGSITPYQQNETFEKQIFLFEFKEG